jgi:sugar/nucleoside kinase (ribokinase family)
MAELHPHVVLANELEHAAFQGGLTPRAVGAEMVVVKQGPEPAIVLRPGFAPVLVPAHSISDVRDTTGAGDAFAAGLLVALAHGRDDLDAVEAGHSLAATIVRRVSA